MSQYDEFDSEFGEETPEEATERLRAAVAAGAWQLRAELVEALAVSAQQEAERQHLDRAVSLIEEALELARQLVDEGDDQLRGPVGRCLLFRAAVLRIQRGPEAGLAAFNETVHYLSEQFDPEDSQSQNELAIALMNRADLQIDPFGAHSAAIAAQEQAARIWKGLLERGETEYRLPFASTLLAVGDSKIQSGDQESALTDYRDALATLREGLESGEDDLQGTLIQGLLKLSRLYDQLGDFPASFDTVQEAIRSVHAMIGEGNAEAEPILTTLFLQAGMLYEKTGDTEAALEEYDECRDIYRRVLHGGRLHSTGEYIARTGLANVLMCRGNMLADLRRYDEAEAAYTEAVQVYRQAAEFRPEDDDETFIPYSIGVVQLNCANMMVAQERLREAVAVKEEAIAALRKRLAAGHSEILPNLLSAYRKMVAVQRQLDDDPTMFAWIDKLIALIESAVDEGRLEYRNDLAASYHFRATCREERGDAEGAESDLFRALRIFRGVADEDADTPDVQTAKLQWAEILERLAMLHIRRGRLDDGLNIFQKEVDDLSFRLEEGDGALFDVLFGYSQFVEFVDGALREEAERIPRERLRHWARIGKTVADSGVELSRKYRDEWGDDPSTSMFFRMKIASFRQNRASLSMLLEEFEESCDDFAAAAEDWRELIEHLDRIRMRDRYYAREASALDADDDLHDGTGDGIGENPSDDPAAGSGEGKRDGVGVPNESRSRRPREFHPDMTPVDPLQDRFRYYVGEYRQTLQRWAIACMALDKVGEAERLFRRDVDVARDLIRREVPGADRFLILSLITFAKAMEPFDDHAGTVPLFEEASQLIRRRVIEDPGSPDDFAMLRHVFASYAVFLHKIGRLGEAENLLNVYTAILETCTRFPGPELWVELVRVLDVRVLWNDRPEQREAADRLQRELFARHPLFDSDPAFQDVD